MKAVVARAGRTRVELEDIVRPAVDAGSVEVRVRAAAVNPADLMVEEGSLREAFGLPDVVGVGYDFAGEVVGWGPQVEGFTVGARVAGLAADLGKGVRSHAEFVVVPVDSLALVPADLSFQAAATVPLNALTAAQALDDLGDPAGRDLLITGAAGAVGGYAVALAAVRGWRVTGLARAADEAFVRAAGADGFVTTAPDRSAEVVFDAAALQDVALAAVRDGGRYHGVLPLAVPAPTRGVRTGAVLVRPDAPELGRLLALATDGALAIRIAGELPLSQVHEAYDRTAKGGQRGRWLLIP